MVDFYDKLWLTDKGKLLTELGYLFQVLGYREAAFTKITPL